VIALGALNSLYDWMNRATFTETLTARCSEPAEACYARTVLCWFDDDLTSSEPATSKSQKQSRAKILPKITIRRRPV
jgi:hypothetical protein